MNLSKGTDMPAESRLSGTELFTVRKNEDGEITVSFSLYTDEMNTYDVLCVCADMLGLLFEKLEGVWPIDSSVMNHLLYETVADVILERRKAKSRSPLEDHGF